MLGKIEYENLYNAIFQEGTVAHAYYEGPEIRITRVNDTMLFYWGKDKKVIGQTFRAALPELQNQVFPDLIENVYRSGETYTGHEMLAELNRDGQLIPAYFNFSYKAVFDEEKNIIGISHIAIDVTEQVLAKKNIEESVNRVRNIVENAPFPIGVYTGEQLEIVLANQAIIDVWGKGSNVIGKRYTDILPELETSQIFQQIKSVFATGVPFQAENQLVTLNVLGQIKSFYFNYQFTPLYDTSGVIYGVMNTAADVTDINLSKQRIERIVQDRTREVNDKNAELERMNINLQSFAFIASHDLQEPLRKVQTFASRIKADETQVLSQESEYLFDRMQLSLARMRDLISDLLEYSQLGSHQYGLESVNLGDLTKEVKENVQDELDKYGAELKIGKMCIASVIPFQVKQLLNNLVNNSLKFLKKELPLIINIESHLKTVNEGERDIIRKGEYCIVTVSDNGIGFEPQYESKIFDIFHRLHNKSDYEGTGIGLAIVKRIADNHNGFIFAKGRPGEGATFELVFPQ